MVELNDQYILIVGHMCNMRLYKRGDQTSVYEESKNSRFKPQVDL